MTMIYGKKLLTLLNTKQTKWENVGVVFIEDGHKINQNEHLFSKIEDEEITFQLEKLNS